MDKNTVISLQQELCRIEDKIGVLNEHIREVIWRQSPAGDRRKSSPTPAHQAATATLHDTNPDTSAPTGSDRRLAQTARLARLREELAEAFQRYHDLHTLLRAMGDTTS